MTKELRFDDQVAVITGAGGGLGKEYALLLASRGARVVVNDIGGSVTGDGSDAAAAGAVVDEIRELGGQAVADTHSVTSPEGGQAIIDTARNAWGRVDILINNAGLQRDSPFQEMTLEKWNYVIGVNLTGQFLCAREAIRIFLKQGIIQGRSRAAGKIICMSSVHEEIPWAGHANYAASKGGIMMLMKSIAQEFAPRKIRINAIGPGAIKTPINHSAWATPAAEKTLLELIPYDRVGDVEDIGLVAVWLASDESDYITGQTIFVDGGMTLFPGFSTNG